MIPPGIMRTVGLMMALIGVSCILPATHAEEYASYSVTMKIVTSTNQGSILSMRPDSKNVDPKADQARFESKYRPQETEYVDGKKIFDFHYHLDGKHYHVHRAVNPQHRRHDWIGEDGAMTGTITEAPHVTLQFHVPYGASHVKLTPLHAMEKAHDIPLVKPKIRIQDANTLNDVQIQQVPWPSQQECASFDFENRILKTVNMTRQKVGRVDHHKNIVFISSGYVRDEKDKFLNHVGVALNFLNGVDNFTMHSAPYDRYWSLVNAYQVFIPDAQPGGQNLYKWNQEQRQGLNTPPPPSNLLGCTYAVESEKMLSCNDIAVQCAAEMTPAASFLHNIVVLVNDDTYGGSARGQLCSLSTREKEYRGLLLHELGHTEGLKDEYLVTTNPQASLKISAGPNCNYYETPVPWQAFIDAGELGAPVRNCTYVDQVKATDGKCVMFSNSMNMDMCPVCHEHMIYSIYDQFKDITAPRCPMPGERSVWEEDEIVQIFLNHLLLDGINFGTPRVMIGDEDAPPSMVKYYKDQATLIFEPFGQAYGRGNHTVKVIFTDYSEHIKTTRVKKETENLISEIKIEIIATGTKAKVCKNHFKSCTLPGKGKVITRMQNSNSYCAICELADEEGCEIDFIPAPREYRSAARIIATVENRIKSGIMSSLIIVAVILLAILFLMQRCETDPKTLDHTKQRRFVRRMKDVMMILNGVAMIGCMVGMTVLFYFYENAGPVLKARYFFLIGLILVAYLVTMFGFFSSIFESRCLLFMNGVILTLSLLSVAFITVQLRTAHNKASIWVFIVNIYPGIACSIQQHFECSGFGISCVDPQRIAAHCPSDCDFQNANPKPCKSELTTDLETLWWPGVGLVAFISFSIIATFSYCCTMVRVKTIVRHMSLQSFRKIPGTRAATQRRAEAELDRSLLANKGQKQSPLGSSPRPKK